MTNELLIFLFESTLVLSLALLGIGLLRGPWLRAFGARSVLLLWLVVPLSLAALLWPAPVQQIDVSERGEAVSSSVPVEPLMPAVRQGIVRIVPTVVPSAGPVHDGLQALSSNVRPDLLLLAGWFGGVMLMALRMASSQWRLMRSLGPLSRRPDGSFVSAVSDTGPALVGAFRPQIVLPEDFERRYSPEQQALILAHERCHLRRGDAQFTLLACVLRCVFWFNPLVHFAWPRFRLDQELACDAAVLQQFPGRRRDYADAMLATRLDSPPVQVGCSWLTGNPLKRRIQMICANPVGKLRLAAGTALVALAGSVAAIGTWSHQEPQRFYRTDSMPRLDLDLLAAEPEADASRWDGSVRMSASPMPPAAVSVRPPELPSAKGPKASRSKPPEAEAASAVASEPTTEPEGAESGADSTDSAQSDLAKVEHARLVEAVRPEFPDTRYQPALVSYPGMPESELPGEDWEPDGSLWVLVLRVSLDATGRAIHTAIEDTTLEDGRMVRRYERMAMDSVRSWRFSSARIDGRAVASQVLLPFYFDTRYNQRAIDRSIVGLQRASPGWRSTLNRATNR